VLLSEVLEVLDPKRGETAVDCTLGRGGHAEALARAVGAFDPASGGRIVGFDRDEGNIDHVRARLAGAALTAIHDSFVRAPAHLERLGLRADVVMADLGFSSTQMDDPSRGFSFSSEGPLDMRFDRSQALTAADLVNGLDEAALADIIHRYGEDPLARSIARKLVRARAIRPIQSTTALAGLVAEAYGPRARVSRLNPATRTFMALRIAVNDELGALTCLLDLISRGAAAADSGSWLRSGARIAIVSFHSLEDRLVKRAFAELVRRRLARSRTSGATKSSPRERESNPRARSARLRAIALVRGHPEP
jgi:16S rRNA (cytosine1402-N4)-methyltransferase